MIVQVRRFNGRIKLPIYAVVLRLQGSYISKEYRDKTPQ
jgi:hypothetical protein